MIFLNIEDFKTQIQEDNLDQITSNDYSILYDAERKAIEEMQSYLALRYDVANIFNRTAAERNALIIMYCVDILLYHVHSRINPRKVPDLRGIRYEAAIAWLTKVAKGLLAPNLPLLDKGKEETNTIGLSSTQKRRNRV